MTISKLKKMCYVIFASIKQKRYKHITYYFSPCNGSHTLFVSFSGFSPNGKPSRYNYLDSLRHVQANCLFILDNHGYKNRGGYYLGDNGDLYLLNEIPELISRIKEEYNISTVVTLGSSKGGTAAILYAILIGADIALAGAPQYYMGTYLSADKLLPLLCGICGNTTSDSIDRLDRLLSDVIRSCANNERKPLICLHYSPYEHTYSEHITDLIANLESNRFTLSLDNDYSYTDYAQVGKYFRAYLNKKCSEIISKGK